jgi:type I restriction enzyme, R subunit
MRQAIEEGFILDVLTNYTTYKTYYRLVKAVEDDPNLPKKKAARALAKFMSLHPHNIEQKTEVMVEHFRRSVMHQIGGGQGDGRHVLAPARRALQAGLRPLHRGERLHRRPPAGGLQRHGQGSGQRSRLHRTGHEPRCRHGASRSASRSLPDRFASPDYQVLLVANKYQTGFDQPLLCTCTWTSGSTACRRCRRCRA